MKIQWLHDSDEDPIWFYQEIGDDNYETRIIEIYQNGRFELATEINDSGGPGLSYEPIPGCDEINEQDALEAEEISKNEFEMVWAYFYRDPSSLREPTPIKPAKPASMPRQFKEYVVPKNEFDQRIELTSLALFNYADIRDESETRGLINLCEDHVSLTQEYIANWWECTKDLDDLTQETFFRYFLSDIDQNSQVFLLTDEGWDDKVIFEFKVSEFYDFSNGYENHYEMAFFQFSWYVLLCHELRLIRYIDEEGMVHTCKFADSSVI